MAAVDTREWITVNFPELKGKYEVCREGFIRNKKSKRILNTWKDKNGYPEVSMNVDKSRSYYLHRVLAQHFIENPNPDNFDVVHHIDENIENWSLDNLQWTTQKGNVQAHMEHRKKIGKKNTKREIRYRVVQYEKKTMKEVKIWKNLKEVSEAGFNRDSVSGTCTYSHDNYRGFVWRYMDEEGTIITKNYEIPKAEGEEFKMIGKIGSKDFSSYRISNLGRIINRRSDILKPSKKKYPTVNLVDTLKKKHQVLVHVLVATLFVDRKTSKKNEVHHVDSNTKNYIASNLRWVTSSENKTAANGLGVKQYDAKSNRLIASHENMSIAIRSLGKNGGQHMIKKSCEDGKIRYGYRWSFQNKSLVSFKNIEMKGVAVRQLDPQSGEVIAAHHNMISAMRALGKQGGVV